jgi:hypothetical protein
MNAFESASNIERLALDRLRPFVQQRAFHGQYVVTSKGPLARELQKTAGDMLYNTDSETVVTVEVKAELENRHGNFFLETWSNRARFTPGWMVTLRSDWLFYYFLTSDELFVIPFRKLQKWAFHQGRIYSFAERQQSKYDQLNDTWGRCVPIAVLARELDLREPMNPEKLLQDKRAA